MERPNVTRYSNYRELLKALVEFKKFKRKTFSYRLLSKLTDVGSPNYFQLVIQGKRNLSDEVAHEVARVLNLSDDESNYFVALVKLAKAKDSEEVHEIERLLQRTKAHLLSRRLTETELPALSSWHRVILRGLVSLKDFEPNAEWIAKKLFSDVEPARIEAALELLTSAGIMKKDESGNYTVGDEILDTGVARVDMRGLCIETLEEWKKLLAKRDLKDADLKYYLVNIPVPASKTAELREKAERLLEEISGWYLDSCQGPKDRLMQVGIFLVPVTRH